ncbi:homoserine dehydrogenase [Tessaracoccus lubricantis]|uniref:Homoserine dehydrogenase n=1 Tax=Tessaracoccus lubricantis TaxID=545543 RepID=A0ABP9FET5_9ACTN
MSKPLKVVLLGAGVVGSQVARIILDEGDTLEARIGRRLELVGIGVRRMDVERPGIDPALLTTDLESLVARDDLDIVIELIGGIDPARSLVRTAISNGASVISANKALLAEDLGELSRLAEEKGVDLHYEAAVAGAIPIIRPLRESLVGDDITEVMGIVNGTTNFILDKMVTDGVSFDSALAEAQQLGYAEADPTADVGGHDAAAKAAILAGLAFHTEVKGQDVFTEGITGVTEADIAAAESMDCTVKLLAVAKLADDDRITVKVHPAMVAKKHPLAAVRGAYNAIFVNSREAGELMFLGAGAGGSPTASAVMGDVVTVGRNRRRGTAAHMSSGYTRRQVAPIGESRAQFYVSFEVEDRPGVLAKCAAVFGDHNVSLRVVQQSYLEDEVHEEGFPARLGVMTHTTTESALADVVAELRESDFVGSEVRVMRLEGF